MIWAQNRRVLHEKNIQILNQFWVACVGFCGVFPEENLFCSKLQRLQHYIQEILNVLFPSFLGELFENLAGVKKAESQEPCLA